LFSEIIFSPLCVVSIHQEQTLKRQILSDLGTLTFGQEIFTLLFPAQGNTKRPKTGKCFSDSQPKFSKVNLEISYDEVLEPRPVTAKLILLPARLISTTIIKPPLLQKKIKPSAILQQMDVLKGSSQILFL